MISLVLGGARSGKSEIGERLAERWSLGAPVTYVATAVAGQGDSDFDERITRHRARRPAHWVTVEVRPSTPLSAPLAATTVVLVDSLGTWLAGHSGFAVDLDDLVTSLERRRASGHPTVLVSDEVGMGVHPETPVGITFRDALGVLNRRVADVANDVRLVVAGRVLMMPPEDA